MNDLQLARAVAEGDHNAIEEFARRYYDSVYRYAWVLCGNREDAEDLTQETLLKARLKARAFRGESALRSWVHSIAYREFLRWRRRNRLWPILGRHVATHDPGFQQVDEADALQAALARLPEALRQIFVLTEICEMKTEEAAIVLGIPKGTAKSRLFHARRRLRELLEPKQREEIDGRKILEV